jgi:hypothetical protein
MFFLRFSIEDKLVDVVSCAIFILVVLSYAQFALLRTYNK